MIRRIALTVGAGVAVLTASAAHSTASQAGLEMSLSPDAGMHATAAVAAAAPKTTRSGYIVASS